MKKIAEKINKFVLRNEISRDRITCRFKTVRPKESITYAQWCREFNVSMLFDRHIVHMN